MLPLAKLVDSFVSPKHGSGKTPVHTGFPDFPASSKSLLKKYLTREVYNQLKGVKDKYGFTIDQLIASGIANPDSNVGIYAGSTDSYVIRDLLFWFLEGIILRLLILTEILSIINRKSSLLFWTVLSKNTTTTDLMLSTSLTGTLAL